MGGQVVRNIYRSWDGEKYFMFSALTQPINEPEFKSWLRYWEARNVRTRVVVLPPTKRYPTRKRIWVHVGDHNRAASVPFEERVDRLYRLLGAGAAKK